MVKRIAPTFQDVGTMPVARRYQLRRFDQDAHGLTIWTSGPPMSGFRIGNDTIEALLDALEQIGHPRVVKG